MKLRYLAMAIGAIGSVVATSSAFAVDNARTQAAFTAGRVINATGATAPTKIVYAAIRNICNLTGAGNTLDIYKAGAVVGDPGDSGFGNSFTYSCRLKAGLTDPDGNAIPWSGLDVVIAFGVSGGSFTSILGQSTATSNQNSFVNGNLSGCGAAAAGATTFGDNVYINCGTGRRRSQGGFSDVEAPIFQDILTGIPGVVPGNIQVSQTFAAQTFGVAASQGLYRALQVAQGLPAGCQDDNFTTGTVTGANDRSPACQPSLTRQDYASIVNNDPFSPTKVDWSFVIAGNTDPVRVCRRLATSGSQASSNAYFLDNPCARGSQTFGERTPAGAADSAPPSFVVVENSGSADVRTCLNASASLSAGVISGENVPETGDTFSFIKLDGVAINEDAKNRASAIAGRYDFAYELVLHTNSDVSVTPAVPGQVLKALAKNLGNPALADLTGLFQVAPGGFSGPTVSRASRGGNSCAPFVY